MKRTMLQKFGILGLISLLSYTAAVVFAPLAYPGYNWLAQAVSDLSADSAPSRTLWNQLSALYMPCGIVCCTMCGLEVSANPNRALRTGVYIFLRDELAVGGGLRYVPAARGRDAGRLSGDDAHGRDGICGAAVDSVADPDNPRRQGSALRTRRMGCLSARNDASRRDRHRNRTGRIFRNTGTLQRIRGDRAQRGAGHVLVQRQACRGEDIRTS